MEKRLNRLKQIMENRTYKQLKFTEEDRDRVLHKINKREENDNEIMLAILQMLQQEKTGYELIQLLRSRGIEKFGAEEGTIYTTLHELEQKQYITAEWNAVTGAKYYKLARKGLKFLQQKEKQVNRHVVQLKKWREV